MVDVDRFVNFSAGDIPGGVRGRVWWPTRSWQFRDDIAVSAWPYRGEPGWVADGRPYPGLAALTARAEAAVAELSGAELMAALARPAGIGERPDAGHDAAFSAPEQPGELERRLGNDEKAERAETIAPLREIAVLRLNEVVGAMGEAARPHGVGTGAHPARHDEKGSRR